MKIACGPRLESRLTLWTNIKNLRGGAKLFPRHTTCPRSHKLLVNSRTNCLPSSMSTQSLLSSCASWGISCDYQHPQELARPRSCQNLFDCLRETMESNWRHGQDLLVEFIEFHRFFHFQHQDPVLRAWLSQGTPMCHPNSTTSLTSSLVISSVRAKSCKVSWRQSWISRAKGTSPLPCQDHGHLYHKTSFARDSDYEQTLSKLPKMIQVQWEITNTENLLCFD